jgi:diketogulonate reductase-like aldo/keto reductase
MDTTQPCPCRYRHIDCACDYGNEHEVGAGIKAAIASGVCTRAELWVTSKLWNTYHAAEHVELACRKTLTDLGLDYVDLYLIHFPIATKYVPIEKRYPPEWIFDPDSKDPKEKMMIPVNVTLRETWGAMEQLKEKGLAREIGVSNHTCQVRGCHTHPPPPPLSVPAVFGYNTIIGGPTGL